MAKHLSLPQMAACGIDATEVITAFPLPQINRWLAELPAIACWQQLTQNLLKPTHPFALHQLLYETVFSDWDTSQGPPPIWIPSDTQIASTNLAALMRSQAIHTYPEFHAWTTRYRAEFWQLMLQKLGIRLRQNYTEIVDLSAGVESPQWLVNARLNIVESCFQAAPTVPAIVFPSPDQSLVYWTYGELQSLTNRVANGLVAAGFAPGDAIAIDLPMMAESVAIYLGIIQAGCVVVSIADSFAANEIVTRLRLSKAKAIFTQDFIFRSGKQLPLYAKVVAADAPAAIVITPESAVQLRSGDRTWTEFLSSKDQFDAVALEPGAHSNILFSSGTTGDPKAIPWTHTTPIKCATDGYLHHNIQAGDVVAWSTNLGWMMGPWLIYASLINRATIALYPEAPTERGYGQFIQDARVTMLGVVPSLVSAWKTSNCMHGLDWSSIKAFSSTGECSNPQDMLFLMALAGYKPIVEYCGGTEIGGGYITGTLAQPCSPATFTTPALGLDFVILDGSDRPADKGEVFILPPAIGLSTELLNKNHHQVYFANTPNLPDCPVPLRRHGDHLERLPNGYYCARGRIDDTMNLGGIKVSSAEIEQALNTVPEICETAAIAIAPLEGGPSQLIVYAVVAPAIQKSADELKVILQTAISQQLNPLFKIRDLMIVNALPRTTSNKVMRRVLRQQYNETRKF
jgi:acetyl-CoA synthetase